MRLREVERIARRAVPGSGAPRVTLLSAGLLHDTYRVDRDHHAFSLRLAAAPSSVARDGIWVLRVVQLAAAAALAPPLVYHDAARGISVQKWVRGRAWSAASARSAASIERIAALLRQVHSLPVPAPARISSPARWVQRYTAALAGAKRTAPPLLAAAAATRLRRLKALPRVAGVVCHSDLHRLNLLDYRRAPAKTRALLLLDWEYAHVVEPFWDLAGWSANNDLPDPLLRRLLAAYLGRAPHAADWTRCKLLCWLYDYVCLLWSELYLSSRRGRDSAGVRPRAAVLRDRLRRHIGDSENFRHTIASIDTFS